MPLDAAAVLALAASCAPNVAPTTLLAIARVESGLNPLAIGVNGPTGKVPAPQDRQAAVRAAEALVAAGENIDLGLSQINVRNLQPLGLTIAEAFDPCANLRAAAQLLAAGYRKAPATPGVQTRLRIALSFYNTGHPYRGFANGYVARVAAAAAQVGRAPAAPAATLRPPVRERAPWAVFPDSSASRPAPFVRTFQMGDRL
jgi:type IV secretion system protein VirB1